jgi:hypothetical protein
MNFDFKEVMAYFYAALSIISLLLSAWFWNNFANGIECKDTSWLIILPISTVFMAAVSIAIIIDKENNQ